LASTNHTSDALFLCRLIRYFPRQFVSRARCIIADEVQCWCNSSCNLTCFKSCCLLYTYDQMLYDVANVALSYLVTRETTQYRLCTLAARPAGIGTMHCCMSTVFAELAARVKGSPGSRLARLAALAPSFVRFSSRGLWKVENPGR